MSVEVGSPLRGSAERPLKVAIVGAGPSGFYAAASLVGRRELEVEVTLLDRLPTPYGLVRGGVAPDHGKMKRVERVYARTAGHERVHYLGNVHVGHDLPVSELNSRFDAVVYATGAEHGKAMGIPGEDLLGVHSAAEFVFWYNGHPDYTDRVYALDEADRAVVVGNGNVAVDVARVLCRSTEELAETDMPAHALSGLQRSTLSEILMLGRRGPAQAAFTPKEARELGQLVGIDVVVEPEEMVRDPATAAWLASEDDVRTAQKNLAVLDELAMRSRDPAARRLRMAFRVSPIAFEGHDGRLTHVVLRRNVLRFRDGRVRPEATEETWRIPTQFAFTAIGYRSSPIPGVPFRDDWGVIPNQGGRVWDRERDEPVDGLYVVGWAKRGPSGLIGTNKGDSIATVDHLLEDLAGKPGAALADGDLADVVRANGGRPVSWSEWERLDLEEQRRGREVGKPREKLVDVGEMLAFLDQP